MSSEAVAATATLDPETVAPFAGAIIETVGGAPSLLTVTGTALAKPVAPLASRAAAVRKCVPFPVVVVSIEIEYGLVVSSAPTFAPSSMNWTPAIEPAGEDAMGGRAGG